MKASVSPESTAVARAAEELREDHCRLERLMDALLAAVAPGAQLAAAEELRRALTAHFNREEHPNGLYDALQLSHPEHRSDVARLVEDHRHIAAEMWQLFQRTRDLESQFRGLKADVADFVGELRQHENREHELAVN